MTLPGVGFTLAVVVALEVGDASRFARGDKLAAYACMTPRVHARGGKTRFGPLRLDVNRYLTWAFVETANVICRHRRLQPRRHTSRLYDRIARRRGHAKAIGAVAGHLAEATYWVLTKRQPYRDPGVTAIRGTQSGRMFLRAESLGIESLGIEPRRLAVGCPARRSLTRETRTDRG